MPNNTTNPNYTSRETLQFPLPEGVYDRASLEGERGSEGRLGEYDLPLGRFPNDEAHEYREILNDPEAERIELTRNNSPTVLEFHPKLLMDVL